MTVEVRLPLLADSMTTGRLGAWLKREGDPVVAGEPLVEVETDKTTVEIEAPVSGILERIAVKAGTDAVPVGALLATIAASSDGARPAPAESTPQVATPAAPVPTTAPDAIAPVRPRAEPQDSLRTDRSPSSDSFDATPVAKKMAQLAGLDLGAVRAEGGGKITKADVELALGRRPGVAPTPAPTAPLTAAPTPDLAGISSPFEDRPLSAMRRVTAARLQQAKQTVPHFYLQADCRVDALLDMRQQWNARREASKISVTDLLVFAASRALHKVPLANTAWTGNAIRVFRSVDIAVAVNTPAGLITPVLRGAQAKSLLALSRELADLASRARTGGLSPSEYTGGTFTISNLGMFGVTGILPILNPPNACILGVGAIEPRPVVSGSQIVPGRVMVITLAADHRAIDGATGAEFLAAVRQFVEDPLSMTLEA